MTATKRKKPVRAATRHARTKRAGVAAAGGYDAMLATQGGCCAICSRAPKPDGRRLDVDHDHRTGLVRGLLCMFCNRMLGWSRDNPDILNAAAIYVKYGRMAACVFRDVVQSQKETQT